MVLVEFLRISYISQSIKFIKDGDWRKCLRSEAEEFLPQKWLTSRIAHIDINFDEIEISLW